MVLAQVVEQHRCVPMIRVRIHWVPGFFICLLTSGVSLKQVHHRSAAFLALLCSMRQSTLNLQRIMNKEREIGGGWGGGSLSQWLAHLVQDPAAPGSIPSIPKEFSQEKLSKIAKVNQGQC